MGNNVLCVDIDQTKVEALRKVISPIFEPGLEEMVFERGQAKPSFQHRH